VSVSALQSGHDAANSIASWGQSGAMADIDILMSTAPNVVAPAPIWLEAIGISGFDVSGGPGPGETYDPSFHEITFVWTIDGAPLPPYAAPENMVQGWNNANVAYGKRVGFCLTEPGTYTVNLWAVDSNGTTGVASTTVTVASADSHYSQSNTVVFAADGDFTGAPNGVLVSDLASLRNTLEARSNPTRLSFKGGEDISNFSLRIHNGRLTHVDTWDGTPVTLRAAADSEIAMLSWTGDGETQITMQNLSFVGNWDATQELGVTNGGFAWNLMKTDAPAICVHKCSVSGGYAMNPSQGHPRTGDAKFMFADCVSTNWRGYGIYCQNVRGGKLYVLGCRLAQHPDALNGGRKEPAFYNINSGFRDEDCRDIYMSCTDVFNITGWSGQYLNQNPSLRFGGNGAVNTSVVVDRVAPLGRLCGCIGAVSQRGIALVICRMCRFGGPTRRPACLPLKPMCPGPATRTPRWRSITTRFCRCSRMRTCRWPPIPAPSRITPKKTTSPMCRKATTRSWLINRSTHRSQTPFRA